MAYIIKTTSDGLIYVKASNVIHVKKPNALEGAKVMGQPLVINVNHIGFLSYNIEGHVTFFMASGFEISMKIFYEEAEEAFNCAKGSIEKIIR
ncbi:MULTISPECIES: hypothetical protein [Chryseobacterium]|jgi:hypothetical protein|uniref:GRAM domain-containing protein n=3 Tax=Chryseobacterium TaxID=59732 RepID=A0A1N7MB23_9FLAO|nr:MULTISPECIES: hypothetical protein [Chryseobacterium]HAO05840.1 hypothetical protein [Chryseobacterium sp.]MBL7880561.1 hypothetical protein [Chryseobacterium gambrini]MCQ4140323.1 hypothetical protein [Chryseobacterium sp. EO14]MCY1659535.1 hypothetical protein [Chryseobacterium sp. SL1]MDO3424745.1 hypothetical protein [Chryseobacterium sp. APV1]